MMKPAFAMLFMLSLFACTGNRTTADKNVSSKTCTCDKRQEEDTIFFATSVQLQEVAGKKVISYTCADIATAIASVSGIDGDERCEYLYDLQCVSGIRDSLGLSDSFTYFSEEMAAMDLSGGGAQHLFFDAVQSKVVAYFEFTVVNKEIRAVTKINMQ